MKIIEKISKRNKDMHGTGQSVIAFLGDSVTQGCFECYTKNNGGIETVFDSGEGYHEKVKKILLKLFPCSDISIINAGISGDKASGGLKRLERDVLKYSPDLVVVSYGLNDASNAEGELDTYVDSLKEIFRKVKESGAELIFMTPNLRCTKVDESITDETLIGFAERISKNENDGWLQKYLDCARKLCEEMNVIVCDYNKVWKMFADGGVDVNDILSNKLNHPTRDMNWFSAYELVKTMFER